MRNTVLVILVGLTCVKWINGKCQDSFKLNEVNEIAKVVNCEEIIGDLDVTGSFAGQLKLDKLKKVNGSIKVDAKDIQSISFDNLQTVVNQIEFKDIISLSTIYMPKLNTVNKLSINTVGGDYSLTFESGLKNLNYLEVFDTRLSKLQGIRAVLLNSVNINGVPELSQLDLPETRKIIDSFEVVGAKKCKVSAPKLEVVGKNLKLVDFTSLSLNSLSAVGGEVTFTGIGSSDLSMPVLTKIGVPGLTISETHQLQHAKFPSLTTIDGFLNIDKAYSLISLDVSRLDKIKDSFAVNSPRLSELKTTDSLRGEGAFRIKSQVECSNLVKSKGLFSEFKCETTKKDDNSNPRDPKDPNSSKNSNNSDHNSSNGLKISASSISLIMSSFAFLFN